MDLDQLKNAWQSDKEVDAPEISLESNKEIHLPLEKMKKNMQMEFYSSVASFPILLISLFLLIKDARLQFYSVMLVLVAFSVFGYYFFKFYKLYQRLDRVNFSTFQSLLQMKYDLQLNAELYKAYYISFLPVLLCEMLILYQGIDFYKDDRHLTMLFVVFVVTLITGFAFLYFLGRLWFQYFYGRYIEQISALVLALSPNEEAIVLDEYNKNAFKFNFAKVDASKRFLMRYFSEKTAGVINILLWIFVFLFLLFAVMFVIGLVLGYTMAKYGY